MLTMKYERKDFFGNRQYTEDSKENYTKEDVKKAFLHLSKDRFSTVQKEDAVYFWEDMADFENQVMTVRVFDGRLSWMHDSRPWELTLMAFFVGSDYKLT